MPTLSCESVCQHAKMIVVISNFRVCFHVSRRMIITNKTYSDISQCYWFSALPNYRGVCQFGDSTTQVKFYLISPYYFREFSIIIARFFSGFLVVAAFKGVTEYGEVSWWIPFMFQQCISVRWRQRSKSRWKLFFVDMLLLPPLLWERTFSTKTRQPNCRTHQTESLQILIYNGQSAKYGLVEAGWWRTTLLLFYFESMIRWIHFKFCSEWAESLTQDYYVPVHREWVSPSSVPVLSITDFF